MAKEEPEQEIGLVQLTQNTGVGMKMPDGKVIDVSDVPVGQAQVLAYLVKTISELNKKL